MLLKSPTQYKYRLVELISTAQHPPLVEYVLQVRRFFWWHNCKTSAKGLIKFTTKEEAIKFLEKHQRDAAVCLQNSISKLI